MAVFNPNRGISLARPSRDSRQLPMHLQILANASLRVLALLDAIIHLASRSGSISITGW
jgi:hypothetical protein